MRGWGFEGVGAGTGGGEGVGEGTRVGEGDGKVSARVRERERERKREGGMREAGMERGGGGGGGGVDGITCSVCACVLLTYLAVFTGESRATQARELIGTVDACSPILTENPSALVVIWRQIKRVAILQ